ncbi:signal peptidase II [Schaalia vaccimaxillae]|uniref:signal peptidase II n=1 Tax=Schaalia vaccimaxillae TaxID=183916 RepID=UPI0003B57617|nr:signal peptidase II [Schaalia vaccimaxillae]
MPTHGHRRLVAGAAKWTLALGIIITAVVSDQLTKVWAQSNLEEGQPIPLVGEFLTLQLVRNSGAAFSVGSSTTWIFTLFSIVILIVLAVMVRRAKTLQAVAATSLLMGGAIGNLIDRMIQPPSIGQGHVVDFINYNGWFVGNVADIWIVFAAVWMAFAVSSEFADRDEKKTISDPNTPGSQDLHGTADE